MKILKNEKGAMSLGNLVLLLVAAIVAYVGIMMAIPQIRYQQVKEVFRNEVARFKVANADVIRKSIKAKLEELNIELYRGEENDWTALRIKAEKGSPAVIEATYFVDVKFIGGYTYTYRFDPKKESGFRL